MQGLRTMTEPDGTKIVLDDRKRRLRDLHREMKLLKIHKRRLKERLKEGRDWPIAVNAYGGLEQADLEKDEVLAPLPDDLKANLDTGPDEKMRLLREEADQHVSFASDHVEIDETVKLARQREY